MEKNKVTKAQMFAQIKAVPAVAENKEMVEFIDHELDLLAKKSANRKPTKKNEENEVLKDKIIEVLKTFENGGTVTDILNADDTFNGMSNQKISSLVRQLVLDGIVVKSTDKKKSIFSIA